MSTQHWVCDLPILSVPHDRAALEGPGNHGRVSDPFPVRERAAIRLINRVASAKKHPRIVAQFGKINNLQRFVKKICALMPVIRTLHTRSDNASREPGLTIASQVCSPDWKPDRSGRGNRAHKTGQLQFSGGL